MKLFIPLLNLQAIALLSWFSSLCTYVDAKTLDGGVQVQVLVGLQTRLDSSEMNRIFSSPNHRLHLRDDKAALAGNAKAHIGACLDLYHSSISDHNKNVSNGKGLELIPIAKDGSRYFLAGSVNDFISYLKNGRIHNGGLFISFEEITNNRNQAKIVAKYEDGESAKKFSQELEECNGFVGSFHRRHSRIDDSVKTSKNDYDVGRMLAPLALNDKFSGTCQLSPTGVKDTKQYYDTNPETVKNYESITGASPEVIRNIYGVPTLDGKCYKPRDSAVFEDGDFIDLNDFACYNEYFGLGRDTVIQPVPISNTSLTDGFDDFLGVTPTGLCELPDCKCLNAVDCVEPNLDTQMLSAMNAGTTIRSVNYDFPINTLIPQYEDLIIQLTALDEQDDLPAVISISYGTCYNTNDPEVARNLVEICNHIGVLTVKKGITFFVSSGDAGATDSGPGRNGVCGVYCQNALAACPYVTAVGGAFGNEPGAQQLSIGQGKNQGFNCVSGGGFSNIFTKENFDLSYQKNAVESWRNQPDASRSRPGYTLPDGSVGAGFPDVSAKSDNVFVFIAGEPTIQAGTSASSPIFAGIVNLCASQLPDDEVGFGWINPMLYQSSSNPEIFFDVIGDNNQYQSFGEECPPPPTVATCPTNNILYAYLTYDGSHGDSVFVTIESNDGDPNPTTFVNRIVTSGESISFGFNLIATFVEFPFSEFVRFKISTLEPVQTIKINESLSTACPGPWSIGNSPVPGFVLDGFIYENDGQLFTEVFVDALEFFFGFQATPGWDPASGIGTIGTTNGQGFSGLCGLLLGKPFDFNELECDKPSKSSKKSKSTKKNSSPT